MRLLGWWKKSDNSDGSRDFTMDIRIPADEAPPQTYHELIKDLKLYCEMVLANKAPAKSNRKTRTTDQIASIPQKHLCNKCSGLGCLSCGGKGYIDN